MGANEATAAPGAPFIPAAQCGADASFALGVQNWRCEAHATELASSLAAEMVRQKTERGIDVDLIKSCDLRRIKDLA